MEDVNKFKGENSVFAKRLKCIMEERNITQQDLSRIAGVTRQAISLYLNGQSLPDIERLYNIAEYLGVSTDYLLGRIDIRSPEIDNVAINKKLGLSDKAIKKLEIINSDKLQTMSKFNLFFENDKFFLFVIRLTDYIASGASTRNSYIVVEDEDNPNKPKEIIKTDRNLTDRSELLYFRTYKTFLNILDTID